MSFLEVKDLKIHFPVRSDSLLSRVKNYVKAVDGVSFSVEQGSVLGIVGESGCGKSTLVKGLMRLTPIKSGEARLMGKDLLSLKGNALKKYRKNFQMVFQDPEASLNPRLTIGEAIAEPIKVFEPSITKKELTKRVQVLMEDVGLSPYMIRRYAHEFSGGQRQRICIARSLAIHPKLIVWDEAVSALDVSIQAQIVNLLNDLKVEHDLTYLFISHDLAITRYISDYVMVMYLGKIVEMGQNEDVVKNPQHPYTKALISAVPQYKNDRKVIKLTGEIPSPINPPKGCAFNTRCSVSVDKCFHTTPPLVEKDNNRILACHCA